MQKLWEIRQTHIDKTRNTCWKYNKRRFEKQQILLENEEIHISKARNTWYRVAEVVRRHIGTLPKSLDSDENFKP